MARVHVLPARRQTSAGGRNKGTGDARAAAIQAWLDAQSATVIAQLAGALRTSERAAGDWLEDHGCPRTWRKQMRAEV